MDLIQKLLSKIEKNALWEKTISLKRNEYLKMKGSICTALYYIEEGSLRIFFEDKNEEHTIRLGYQGNFIASLDSFISEKPSELYIQAIKKCKLKVVYKLDFMEFIYNDAESLKLWHSILLELVYQQMEREKDLLTSSPLQRYQRVLARSPQLFQQIPSKYIASYLRMTPETLSRIKKS